MQDIYRSYETEELVAMYQSTQKEEYLQEIMIRNSGLLHGWVWQYRNIPSYDKEDLLEEAHIACWRAVEGYDPSKGVAFTTFLKVNVVQQLNRLYAEATRQKRFTGCLPDSYEELTEVNRDGVSMRSFTVECLELSEIEVKEFMESISGTIREVAVMLYDGMTKGEVAKALGITPASTTYHLKKLQQAYIAYFGEAV